MININNIFGYFSSDETPNPKVEVYFDFTQTPTYWIGMYKKLIINYKHFNKILAKSLAESNTPVKSMDTMKEASERIIYAKAWGYIQNIDTTNPTHISAIEKYSKEYLDVALELGINFFEEIEDYEKSAFLKKILDKVKEFAK